MTAEIVDLSYWNRPIPWSALHAAGVECVIVRGPIGANGSDDDFKANWAQAKTFPRHGIYGDVSRTQSATAQVDNFLAVCAGDFGTEPLALDVERTNAERQAMAAGWAWPMVEYTALLRSMLLALAAPTPVRIYTSKVEWEAMTTRPAWGKDYPNWLAHYNSHITEPDAPAGWVWDWWQYGQAVIGGKSIDVNRERVKPMPTMPKVMVPHGSLVAIHAINPGITQELVEEAVAAGAPYSAVKILNDAEALAKVKQASPTTWTYLRYFNPDDDSLQGLDDWTTTQRGEWCDRVLHKIYSQITAEQCKWVDWACAWNEEDPPGPQGYKDLGETFLMLIEKNEARKAAGLPYVKLALGCLAQGTPELWEIDQLVDTGLFKRMHDLFYSWDVHEGAFAWQQITEGYQSKMPSTPAIAALGPGHGDVAPWPGSGSGSFRFVWTFERRLRPLGQLVPLLIGEMYPGVPGELERYNWYDDHACIFEYLTGFALYNLGPTKDWPDLTPDYKAMKQHRIDIRSRVNGGLMPNVTDADLAQLLTNNQNDAVILTKYKPTAKHTMATHTNQWVIDLFHKTFGGYTELDALGGVQHLVDLGRQVGYVGPALEDTKLTAPQLSALTLAGA